MAEGRDRADRMAALARELTRQPDLAQVVQRVAAFVAENLGRELSVSVSLVRRGRDVETPAATDARAVRADQLQYQLGEGPCLDAIWKQATSGVDDLVVDRQYPDWSTRVAAETGLRSVLSLRLFVDEDESLGALNLFSPHVRGFDGATRSDALAFAAQAAVAVTRGRMEEHLRTAMRTRGLIGQAQGILMERLRITADQAFGILSRLSQERNTKLREVARYLVETGEIPLGDPGTSRGDTGDRGGGRRGTPGGR
ncbi:GAF and ANTAR domain-containing protein [Geodermatophilus sp. SYSU D00758]